MAEGGTTIEVGAGGVGAGGTGPAAGSDALGEVVSSMRTMSSQVGTLASELSKVVTAIKQTNDALGAMSSTLGGRGGGGGAPPSGTSAADAGIAAGAGGRGGLRGDLLDLIGSMRTLKTIAPETFRQMADSAKANIAQTRGQLKGLIEEYQTLAADDPSRPDKARAITATRMMYDRQAALAGEGGADRYRSIQAGLGLASAVASTASHLQGDYLTRQIARASATNEISYLQAATTAAATARPLEQYVSAAGFGAQMARAGLQGDYGSIVAYMQAQRGTARATIEAQTTAAMAGQATSEERLRIHAQELQNRVTMSRYGMGLAALGMVGGAVGLLGASAAAVGTGGLTLAGAMPSISAIGAGVTGVSAAYTMGDVADQQLRINAAEQAKFAASKRTREEFQTDITRQVMSQLQQTQSPLAMEGLQRAISQGPGIARLERRTGVTGLTSVGILAQGQVYSTEDMYSMLGGVTGFFGGKGLNQTQMYQTLSDVSQFGVSGQEAAGMYRSFGRGRNAAAAGSSARNAFMVAKNVVGDTDLALAAANAAAELSYGMGGVTGGSAADLTNTILGLAGSRGPINAFSIQEAVGAVRGADRMGRSELTTARMFSMLKGEKGYSFAKASALAGASALELLRGSEELSDLGITKTQRGIALKARVGVLDTLGTLGVSGGAEQAAVLKQQLGVNYEQARDIIDLVTGRNTKTNGSTAPPEVQPSSAIRTEEALKAKQDAINERARDAALGGTANQVVRAGTEAAKGADAPLTDPNQVLGAAASAMGNFATALDELTKKIQNLHL